MEGGEGDWAHRIHAGYDVREGAFAKPYLSHNISFTTYIGKKEAGPD